MPKHEKENKAKGSLSSFEEVLVNAAYSISSANCFNTVSSHDDIFLIGGKRCEGSSSKEKIVFFKQFVRYLMFFSYRKDFSKLLDGGGTTDVGWGCILRAAQMLLAVALLRHANNSGELSIECCEEQAAQKTHVQHSLNCSYHSIQSLFMDVYSAPFSFHRLSEKVHQSGVPYHSNMTPTEASNALVAASSGISFSFSKRCAFRIIKIAALEVPVLNILLQEGSSLLLLFPIVLGYKKVSKVYLSVLFEIMKWECCCGLIVGVKSAAYFAFGFQKGKFLCLNPHIVQRAFLPNTTPNIRTGRCFTIPAKKVEPSVLISLYIHDETAFQIFCEDLKKLNKNLPLPLITIIE